MHRPDRATSFEPLETAVPEAWIAQSHAQAILICVWFQSGGYWPKLGGCLPATTRCCLWVWYDLLRTQSETVVLSGQNSPGPRIWCVCI